MRKRFDLLVVCALFARAHGLRVTRRSVGALVGSAMCAPAMKARAEVYEGSSPLDLVEDVRKATEREFVDASLAASTRWRSAVDAAKAAALDADSDAAGPSIVATMLRATGDPYTRFLAPQLAAAMRSAATGGGAGGAGGVGIVLDGAAVADVVAGAPAAASALRAGDVIVTVDGARGLEGAALAAALRGAPGTVARVAARRPDDGEIVEATLTRAPLRPPAAETELVAVQGGVGIVALRGVSSATGPALEAALLDARRRGAAAFALDIRGNGGGNVEGGLAAAALFAPNGATLATVRSRNRVDVRTAEGPRAFPEPVAVLVDGGTASAAELLAGSLRDRGALLVGERTYGKARIQRAVDLPGGGTLLVTRATYLTPSGADLDGTGLRPTRACADDGCLAALAPILLGRSESLQGDPAASTLR